MESFHVFAEDRKPLRKHPTKDEEREKCAAEDQDALTEVGASSGAGFLRPIDEVSVLGGGVIWHRVGGYLSVVMMGIRPDRGLSVV